MRISPLPSSSAHLRSRSLPRLQIQRRWRQIKSNEVVTGNFVEFKGQMCKVEKVETTMQGRGSNFFQLELRAVANNKKHSARLRSGEKIELIEMRRLTMQYLYSDGSNAHFMNPETFEQTSSPVEVLGNYQYYAIEGEEIEVQVTEEGGDVVFADTPNFAEIEIESISNTNEGRATSEKLTGVGVNGRVIIACAKHLEPGTRVRVKVDTEEYAGKAET